MRRRIFTLCLLAALLLASIPGTAHASSGAVAAGPSSVPSIQACAHKYGKPDVLAEPTEAKNGLLRYYCTVKGCKHYFDEAIPALPTVYVSKFRHKEAGLCTRITVAQKGDIVGDTMTCTMERWNGKLMADQYEYNWEDDHIKQRFLEFKVKDVGIGTFDKKVSSYSLSVPVNAITACEENGDVVLFLTTGAAMIRLSKDATSSLVSQAKESIGVKVSCDGKELNAEILADGKAVPAPNGVEMLYWVKDAGEMETVSNEVLARVDYKNFNTKGDFDLIFVESLNGVVNCSH